MPKRFGIGLATPRTAVEDTAVQSTIAAAGQLLGAAGWQEAWQQGIALLGQGPPTYPLGTLPTVGRAYRLRWRR